MHPSGFQVLILVLNPAQDLAPLIDSGSKSHVFGPLKDNVSLPLIFANSYDVLSVIYPFQVNLGRKSRGLYIQVVVLSRGGY